MKNLAKNLEDLSCSNKDFIVFVSNCLYCFGKEYTLKDPTFINLDLTDYKQIEAVHVLYPNNVYLAALVQSHILLKWSENL